MGSSLSKIHNFSQGASDTIKVKFYDWNVSKMSESLGLRGWIHWREKTLALIVPMPLLYFEEVENRGELDAHIKELVSQSIQEFGDDEYVTVLETRLERDDRNDDPCPYFFLVVTKSKATLWVTGEGNRTIVNRSGAFVEARYVSQDDLFRTILNFDQRQST
jgi:hypothetical protein